MSKKKVVNKNIERDQLITILRKPSGLAAVINRRRNRFTMSIWDPDRNNSFEQLSDFYEIVETPLEKAASALVPRKNKLLNCWNQLSNVRSFNPHTLYSIFRVLIETQHQPEQTKTNFSANLNEALCNARNRNELLFDLNYLWSDASEILKKAGYNSERLQVLYFGKPSNFDPYYLHHFPDIANFPKLPDDFRIFILPSLKNHPWKIVEIWLGLYRSLELNRKSNLLRAISRMLSLGEESIVREWCDAIVSCSLNKRAVFATIIVETRSFKKDPREIPNDAFPNFFSLTTKKQFVPRLHYFLRAIKENISFDYLFAGFRLANRYRPEAHLYTLRNCKEFPYETVVDLADLIRSRFPKSGDISLSIWEECSRMPGLMKLISNPIWKQIGLEAAYSLLHFCAEDIYLQQSKTKGMFTDKIMPEILELLRYRVPKDYRTKFCKGLRQLFWFWNKTEEFVKHIPDCSKVLLRFCSPPFDRQKLNVDALFPFIYLFHIVGNALLGAPNSSFLTLEKECSSENDSRLIGRGIRTLLNNAKVFTVKSFQHFPRKLFQITKILGTYRHPARLQIVKDFMKTPVMKQRFRKLTLHESADFIRSEIRPGITNPIPKALTKFLSGEYSLTNTRKRRYRKIMFENLNLTRLELLEAFIWENANKNFATAVSNDGVKHAVQLVQLIDKNRRQLKRYLHSYINGHKHYVSDHPRTKQWISAHPNLNVDLWQKGIQFTENDSELGKIHINVEEDPFEILRMGTYVGSCLGLGGFNAFSAAAVMLDFNKQVLYARNDQRKVIGRQLIALSEQNQLVCFSAYPVKISEKIKGFFKKYDRQLARELDIPICSSQKYDIKNILSQGWYDDSAWNLKD